MWIPLKSNLDVDPAEGFGRLTRVGYEKVWPTRKAVVYKRIDPGQPTVRLDVCSSLDMLDLVQAVSDHIGRSAGLDDDVLHWIKVAVRESVINAIRHGNQNDVGKRVHIEFTPLDDGSPGVAIRVRDEGIGFDPADLPDCKAPENILKSGGRGIFLIRSLMDDLVLRRAPEGGMEIVMVKRAQPQQA